MITSILPLVCVAMQPAGVLLAGSEPPSEQNLVLAAPIKTWDEAVPLGNGLTGGLLWGEGNVIRLSLDRGDLWDERPAIEPGWCGRWRHEQRPGDSKE